MTGAEFYAFVLRTFIRTDKETEFYEAVNNTLREMRRRHSFNENKVESYTTGISALGDYMLDLPSNFGTLLSDVVLSKTDTQYPPLQKLDKTVFDKKYPNPTSTNVNKSQPQHFCLFASKIILGPVPDSLSYLYTMSYATKLVTKITSATGTMPFDDFEEGLKYGVLARLYADLEDDAMATKYFTLFEKLFAEYITQDKENTAAPKQVAYHGI